MRLRAGPLPRILVVVGVVSSLVVPALALPRLPTVTVWPVLLALVPWLLGKYVCCPLRWQAVTAGPLPARWYLRTFAEAELLGMITPGHVGSDLWRLHRLTGTGLPRPDAICSVGLDRLVGAVALAGFVAGAAATLPTSLMMAASGIGAGLAIVALAVRRWRPSLLPSRPLPAPDRLAVGLALSVAYQLSIVALLYGLLVAVGQPVSPLPLLGAFAASQLAGALPGPHGASPRDAALVVALAALGVPWTAAAAAVSLKALLAWLPALAIGGTGLWRGRRTPVEPTAPVLAAPVLA